MNKDQLHVLLQGLENLSHSSAQDAQAQRQALIDHVKDMQAASARLKMLRTDAPVAKTLPAHARRKILPVNGANNCAVHACALMESDKGRLIDKY